MSDSTEPPFRAALVGCGPRGGTHARALADADRFEFVAACDVDEERAEATAAEYGVEAFADARTAVAETGVAHVSVATPPTVRLPVLEDVVAGDPASVLFEKPVANDYAEVAAVADLFDGADALATVCYQHVYAEELRETKSWLDGGRVGDPVRVVATTKGGLSEHGTHLLHALNWLLDAEPTAVRAFAEGAETLDPAGGKTPVSEPEDATLELSYPGGVRAFCHLGSGAPDVPEQADTFWLEYRVDVVGTGGRASFVLGDGADLVAAGGAERAASRPFDEDAYMTRALYGDLAARLAGERDGHPADLASALAVHRTVEAALRSALERRAVDPGTVAARDGDTTAERLRRALADSPSGGTSGT